MQEDIGCFSLKQLVVMESEEIRKHKDYNVKRREKINNKNI